MSGEKTLQSILPFHNLGSKIALYEMSHGTLNYNSDRIESLLYNPIQPGLFDPLSNNLNPDSNFLNRLPTISINLLAFYHQRRSLIDYATHYLFCDR